MSAKDYPAFLFYPSDWMTDMAVQSMTFEDRGIWFAILCVMHECEERGKLILNGKPIPPRTLAQLISCDLKKLNRTMDVLLNQKVVRIDDRKVIYNKRMVRDEYIRHLRAAAGSKGGNPNLVNQNDKQNDKQKSTPSVSSSNSSSISERVLELADKCHLNEIWLDKTSVSLGIPAQKIKTFCDQWAKDAELKYKFETYTVNQLIGFMLADLRTAKPELDPPAPKPKTPHDQW